MNAWGLFSRINARSILLIVMLVTIAATWGLVRVTRQLPEHETTGHTTQRPASPETVREELITWAPLEDTTNNPFHSRYLLRVQKERARAERKRRQAEEKRRAEERKQRQQKNQKSSDKEKPQTGTKKSQPKPKPDFLLRKAILTYKGLITRTDGSTVGLVQLQSGKLLTVRPGDRLPGNIQVTEFSRNSLRIRLSGGDTATIETGEKAGFEYKVPRKQ
jgi:hypothetical protein